MLVLKILKLYDIYLDLSHQLSQLIFSICYLPYHCDVNLVLQVSLPVFVIVVYLRVELRQLQELSKKLVTYNSLTGSSEGLTEESSRVELDATSLARSRRNFSCL